MPKGQVGLMVRCAYGTRDAGAIWEDTYTAALVEIGFNRGVAGACCFYHPVRDISVVVHGDDFTALGEDSDLSWYEQGLANYFELKIRGRMGQDKDDCKEIRILNRILRLTDEGLRYEADPRHAEILIQSLGLSASKPVVTPGVKSSEEVDGAVGDEPIELVSSLCTEPARTPNKKNTKVSISVGSNTYHDITPYSEVYACHPRSIASTKNGFLEFLGDAIPLLARP